MSAPKPLEIYKHFKGNLYQIICIAVDSETGEKQVIYRPLYEQQGEATIYSRKLEMFMSDVDREKYPSVTQMKRFEKVIFDDVTKKEEASVKEEVSSDVEKATEKSLEESVSEDIDKTDDEPEVKSQINPALLKFLDATGYDEQLECLTSIRESLTEEILIPIELSLGMEEQKGSIDQRYRGIKNFICLKQRYEKSDRRY